VTADFIDLQFRGSPRVIATPILPAADGVTLIDPGPTSCLPALESGLRDRGLTLRDVRTILLTHIHLDHAGACGTIVVVTVVGSVFGTVFGAVLPVLPVLPVAFGAVGFTAVLSVALGVAVPVAGFGALGIGGAVALIAGGLLLTTSDNPDFQVSRWLVVAVGVVFAGFFAMVATALLRMRRMPASMGVRAMIGQRATARSPLDPEGIVFIKGERWKAVAEDGPVLEGDTVEVVDVKGLTLFVRPRRDPQPQA